MSSTMHAQVQHWHNTLTPVMAILHHLTTNTEDQFLELGRQLQDFSQRSAGISATACSVVELVAGSDSIALNQRLRSLFTDMEAYLARVNQQGHDSCRTLEQIMAQLNEVVQPLEGFRKMDKALRMLSISTKIESARLGELGSGFITLAMDVEKLSQAVSEKSAGIMAQRLTLTHVITTNLEMVQTTETNQFANAQSILATVGDNLQTLENLNAACSESGQQAGMISEQVSADIATVVSSMQFHDITRQQIEHIIEALTKLQQQISSHTGIDEQAARTIAAETGDVCELQSAQLHHAAEQLANATQTILESLQDVASKQVQVTCGLQQALMGNAGSSDNSLLEAMETEMHEVTQILQSCDRADQELATAMQQVAVTISQIGSFVSDIEAVGTEIDLIALNAQIKAAHTGEQGAALGVLAEAIKRLSLDAVIQTEAVSATLKAINTITADMNNANLLNEDQLFGQVAVMEQEAGQIIASLAAINRALLQQLGNLAASSESLTDDINSTVSSMQVHQDVKRQAEEAAASLTEIYTEARALVPASNEFRNNLRHMEQRYTMESERMIHEMLAARHGVKLNLQKQQDTGGSGSEFGDNVDLF